MERFILVTEGPINARRFMVVDTDDKYNRVKALATTWEEGECLVEYLNRGSVDAGYWDQVRRDIDADAARARNGEGHPSTDGWPASLPRSKDWAARDAEDGGS